MTHGNPGVPGHEHHVVLQRFGHDLVVLQPRPAAVSDGDGDMATLMSQVDQLRAQALVDEQLDRHARVAGMRRVLFTFHPVAVASAFTGRPRRGRMTTYTFAASTWS